MKKKHSEHVNLERWLVSYADFITLLFAFFVVMYAISQADSAKLKKVSTSMKAAFNQAPAGTIDLGGGSGGSTANAFDTNQLHQGRLHDLPAGKTNTAASEDHELQEIHELLEETVSLELGATELSDKLQMQFDSRGLIVRIAAKDFFGENHAEVRPDFWPLLDRIGKIVSQTKRLIRIEGHTDSQESKTKQYSSDWELSSARAAWVAKYWLAHFPQLEPSRIGIAGYSHFRPLSQGQDSWERAKNRRVEIIILNNKYE